jgi:CheY-like chemotaxis protein
VTPIDQIAASITPDTILVIEDNDQDFEVLQRVFGRVGVTAPLLRLRSGEDALRVLLDEMPQDGPFRGPRMLILDLYLPGKDGRQVLAGLKADARYRRLPVIVFSGSDEPDDVLSCYDQSANCYMTKPVGYDQFVEAVQAFRDFWLTIALLPSDLSGKRGHGKDSPH